MAAMTKTASFWDKIAERYAARPVGDPDAYEHTLNRVRSYLSPEDRVLEIGCGTGTTALKLADVVAEVIATDISTGMIGTARRKAADQGAANVRFLTADATEALGSGGWNAVMAFSLLHLLRDPEHVVREVHAALEPGGLFISKTTCLGGRAWLFGPIIRAMQLFGRAPYVRFFRPEELEEMIAEQGFEIVETGSFPASPPARFIVARKR